MEENQEQNIEQTEQTSNNTIGRPTESDTQNLDVLLQDPKLQA